MAKYVIGLDYGTNTVRTLIVDVASGKEIATAVWPYHHGKEGVILGRDPQPGPPAPGRLRQRRRKDHPLGPGQGPQVRQAIQPRRRHRHRRGHHRLDPPAGGLRRDARWRSTNASPRTPPRWPGCGRTTPPSPRRRRSPPWPSKIRPHYLAKCGGRYSSRVVLQQDSALPADQPGGLSTPPTRGWRSPTGFRPCSPAPNRRGDSRSASVPPGTRPCTTTPGAATPTRSSWAGSIRPWRELRAAAGAQGLHRRPSRRRPDGRVGQADRPARGHPRGRRGVRRPPGRRRGGHRAGHAGQDHRHQHLRHDGRPAQQAPGRHPRPVRHRQRQHPAGLLRPGGGPVGRRRHLQLVRQLHPARAAPRAARTRP